ncbi:MAG: nucleoside 2-deoxyribosyltransferase [Aureispira sp.]|nr:nucleoside 2-deoxyribosyltransferase [Aureispira sp.]
MKIYFAGSIRGGREDANLYLMIINYLKNFGEVLTEHVGEASLTSFGEGGTTEEFIHDRDMRWLLSSDIIVAEVTCPSLGVGYEIGRAIEHGKKVICLYRPQEGKRLSAMIAGSQDLILEQYSDLETAKKIIKRHLPTL